MAKSIHCTQNTYFSPATYAHCFSLLPCIWLWIVPRFMCRSKYHKEIFPSRHSTWARFGCCLCRPLSLWIETWKATEKKGIKGKLKWCKLATILTPSFHPQWTSSDTPAVLAGDGGATPHKCTMVGSPLKTKTSPQEMTDCGGGLWQKAALEQRMLCGQNRASAFPYLCWKRWIKP